MRQHAKSPAIFEKLIFVVSILLLLGDFGVSYGSDRAPDRYPKLLYGKWQLVSIENRTYLSNEESVFISKDGATVRHECNWLLLIIEIDNDVLRAVRRGPETAMRCGSDATYPVERTIVLQSISGSRYEVDENRLRLFPQEHGAPSILEFRRAD